MNSTRLMIISTLIVQTNKINFDRRSTRIRFSW